MTRRQACATALAAWALALAAAPAVANGPQLEALATPPPAELAAGVRQLLGSAGHRVVEDGKVLAELWLRRELDAPATPSPAFGVEYRQLESGALVGAAHFPAGWVDYRAAPVAAGVYTLRYGVQPANGDHMGVSEYRDFLLLLPAAADGDGHRVYEHDALVEASTGASGTVHPAVLALFPIWDEVAPPALVRNEIEQWTVVVAVGNSLLGLVVVGHGEL